MLIHGSTAYICDECAVQAVEISKQESAKDKKSFSKNDIPKPSEIKHYLDEYIIGQDEAKKHLSVAV
jgi:ATP-dependent Clp protease ATP-binding subunit ClpX